MRGGLITGDISLYRLAATNRQTRVRPDFVQNFKKGQMTAFTVAVFLLDMQLLITLQVEKKKKGLHARRKCEQGVAERQRKPSCQLGCCSSPPIRCGAECTEVTSRLSSALLLCYSAERKSAYHICTKRCKMNTRPDFSLTVNAQLVHIFIHTAHASMPPKILKCKYATKT